MSQTTGISWTDATWNPVHGCSKVSPGCAHCYAETLSRRYRQTPAPWTPANAERNVILKPHKLREPLKWKTPRMVFVNSMSDLFHELVPDEYILRVFEVMAAARQHTFQVLTKRPERMAALMPEINALLFDNQIHVPLPNVWLGVSIENRRFVHRADVLRATPAAVRFISAEPLLGPLVARYRAEFGSNYGPTVRYPWLWDDGRECNAAAPELDLMDIDWLIVGGESGPGHRPMDHGWARGLRNHCERSGTALFVKQLGGARPGTKLDDLPEDLRIREYPNAVTA